MNMIFSAKMKLFCPQQRIDDCQNNHIFEQIYRKNDSHCGYCKSKENLRNFCFLWLVWWSVRLSMWDSANYYSCQWPTESKNKINKNLISLNIQNATKFWCAIPCFEVIITKLKFIASKTWKSNVIYLNSSVYEASSVLNRLTLLYQSIICV